MRISDWSSDVCSSDLNLLEIDVAAVVRQPDLGFEAGTDDLLAAQRFDAFGDERARVANPCPFLLQPVIPAKAGIQGDRKSVVSVKSVYARVDLGGRRIIQENKNKLRQSTSTKT